MTGMPVAILKSECLGQNKCGKIVNLRGFEG